MRGRLAASAGGPVWPIVGIALVLLGIGAILVSSAYDEPRKAERLGRNVPVNEGATDAADISAHNSPTLVRNPRNARNLVIANRIDTPRFGCALHVSFDAGVSWTQTPIPAPTGERACYAPDVTFSADGTLHLSFVTLRGRANAPNAGWTSSSTNGGKTLSEPVKVLDELAFQLRLVADPARPKRLYMTWLQASEVGLYRFTEPGNPIRVARSDDGGDTWQEPVRVNDSDRQRVVAPAPVVGPNGQLYVLYLDLGDDLLDYSGAHRGRGGPPYDGNWQLVLARSRDRGQTWSESVVEDRLVPSERFVVFTPPFPSLAVDRDSGRLYAGFHDRRLGDQDVWVWSRGAEERAWTEPVRVNDTPRRDKTSQYLPRLAVAPSGRLDVLYYDRRADRDDNVLTRASLQSSSDDGKRFGGSVTVSDATFDSRIGVGSERDLPDPGSRLALLSTDERAFAVWADARAGTRTSNKQDLVRATIEFSDPARISSGLENLLRYGGIALALLGALLLVLWALSQLSERRRLEY